jgi:hypothetical protein
MHAVRRLLTTAGVAGVLVLAAAGSAWGADPTPSADPSASPTASADPSATPTPTDSPSPSAEPTEEPAPGGCDENPEICQAGGVPGTTTDCGQVGPGGEAASPPPPGVICIASGLNPETTSGSGAGSGAPGTLPRTGPAPLVPTLALGGWLLLLGVVSALAGRRRTARV